MIVDPDRGDVQADENTATAAIFGIGPLLFPDSPEYKQVRKQLLSKPKGVLHPNVLRSELEAAEDHSISAGWHYRRILRNFLRNTNIKFQLWFDGYGNDPREIWDIDEIKIFCTMFLLGKTWMEDKEKYRSETDEDGMVDYSVDVDKTFKPVVQHMASYKDFIRLVQGLENLRGMKNARRPIKVGTGYQYHKDFLIRWTPIWNTLHPNDLQPLPFDENEVEALLASLPDTHWGFGKTRRPSP